MSQGVLGILPPTAASQKCYYSYMFRHHGNTFRYVVVLLFFLVGESKRERSTYVCYVCNLLSRPADDIYGRWEGGYSAGRPSYPRYFWLTFWRVGGYAKTARSGWSAVLLHLNNCRVPLINVLVTVGLIMAQF
jgi:hypothetical protein